MSDMKTDFESCLGAKVGTDPPLGGVLNASTRRSGGHTHPLSLCLTPSPFSSPPPSPHLCSQQGFKGFQVAAERHAAAVPFQFGGAEYTLGHGSVVIAAITSCTNTSNPSVMLGAGGCVETVPKLS